MLRLSLHAPVAVVRIAKEGQVIETAGGYVLVSQANVRTGALITSWDAFLP